MVPTSPRQPATRFIFITLVLAIVGLGLLIPVLPSLVKQFKGGDEAAGSHAYGWLVSIYAVMQFIGSPILGSLSDRFGRRRIILIATAGSAIDYCIMALAPSLSWLFVARIIAGFTAGVLATANAYITDITPPDKRAAAFGTLGAAFGIGFVIGPALGGFLGDINIHLPFWFAAGCSGLNWIYGLVVLPESLKPEHRRPFSWKRANPVGALLALRRLPAVLGLAEAYFIQMLAQSMMFTIWALYTDHRYQWSKSAVGLSLMFVGVLTGLVQAVLVKKIVPKLGDTRAVVLGMGISILAYVGYGLSPYGWLIYVIIFFGAFGGIAGPAMQSYISKHVAHNEQGSVQGVLVGLQSLAAIPGPFIATWSFGWAISAGHAPSLSGIAFFEAAACIAVALLMVARSFRRDRLAAAVPAH